MHYMLYSRKSASGIISSCQYWRFLLYPLECGKCDTSRIPITPRASHTKVGDPGRLTHSTNKNQGKGESRLCLVRELLVNGKWKLEDG